MSTLVPLFPLATVLFPEMIVPLHIFEERYRRLMRERQGTDPIFGIVLTRRGNETGDHPEFHETGAGARLVAAGRYPDGRYDIVVKGGQRFQVKSGEWIEGCFWAGVEWIAAPNGGGADLHLDRMATLARRYERVIALFEQTSGLTVTRDVLPDEPAALAYAISARLPLDNRERQRLLEHASMTELLDDLLGVLRREEALLRGMGDGSMALHHPGSRFTSN